MAEEGRLGRVVCPPMRFPQAAVTARPSAVQRVSKAELLCIGLIKGMKRRDIAKHESGRDQVTGHDVK